MKENNLHDTENEFEFIGLMPHPFGTYQKATYVLRSTEDRDLYRFTTTSRSEQECIEIMKKIAQSKINLQAHTMAVYKIENGQKKEIWRELVLPQ